MLAIRYVLPIKINSLREHVPWALLQAFRDFFFSGLFTWTSCSWFYRSRHVLGRFFDLRMHQKWSFEMKSFAAFNVYRTEDYDFILRRVHLLQILCDIWDTSNQEISKSSKVNTILKMTITFDVSSLRFLGSVSFFGKFTPNLSSNTEPHTRENVSSGDGKRSNKQHFYVSKRFFVPLLISIF